MIPGDGIAAVMLSLRKLATNRESEGVTRAHLTSFIYLMDLFRPTYGMWSTGFSYTQRGAGFFSRQIDATLAFLVSNLVVRVSPEEHDGVIEFTGTGQQLAEEAYRTLSGYPIATLVSDLSVSLRGVSATTLAALFRVVYSERSLRDAQISHGGGTHPLPSVGTPYHPSVQAQAVVERFLVTDRDAPSPRADVITAHLRYTAVLAETRRLNL